ncbi:MAG: UbiA family prenyltransferase [Planctomycetota bacterium]
MAALLHRAGPLLRLARLTLTFGVVGNLWFVVLWSRELAARAGAELPPLALELGAGALVSGGLVAFGASLNDSFDLERDRSLHPMRPMASGDVSERTASLVLAIALLLGLLGAVAFGALGAVIAIGTAFGVVVLISTGRFVPGFGLPLIATLYGLHMFVARPGLAFTWPVVLVVTHSFVSAALAHTMGGKSPRISRRSWAVSVAAWFGVVLALLALGRHRLGGATGAWPMDLPLTAAVLPSVAAAVFAVVVARKVRQVGRGPRAAEKVGRYAALWLPLYGSCWLAGAGAWTSAGGLALFTLFGFAGASTAREMVGLIDRPVAYRR